MTRRQQGLKDFLDRKTLVGIFWKTIQSPKTALDFIIVIIITALPSLRRSLPCSHP